MTRQAHKAVRNVTVLSFGLAVRTVISLLAAALLPRVLGAADFGLLSAVTAVIAILMVVAGVGLQVVVDRYIPPLLAAAERSRLERLVASVWSLRLTAAVVASIIALAWLASSGLEGGGVFLLVGAGSLALSRYLVEAVRSFLLPLGRPGQSTLLDAAQMGVVLIGLLLGYRLGGLPGALIAVAVANVVLFVLSYRWVDKLVPLGLGDRHFASLRPHLGYAVATFVGSVAAAVQTWFPVWVVAHRAGAVEAAFLGLGVQVYGLVKSFFVTSRQAIFPVLAELAAEGEDERSAYWVDWMMRLGVMYTCAMTVTWVVIGRDLMDLLWGSEFDPAHRTIAVMLAASVGFAGGASCNGYLFVHERAFAASSNLVLFSVVTVAGVVTLLSRGGPQVATAVSLVYCVGAFVFFASGYLLVWASGLARPRLWPCLLLMMPLTLLAADLPLPESAAMRVGLALGFLGAYALLALALRLVRLNELGYLGRVLRGGGV